MLPLILSLLLFLEGINAKSGMLVLVGLVRVELSRVELYPLPLLCYQISRLTCIFNDYFWRKKVQSRERLTLVGPADPSCIQLYLLPLLRYQMSQPV